LRILDQVFEERGKRVGMREPGTGMERVSLDSQSLLSAS